MKYSIFIVYLAGTALAAPMSNSINERQVQDAPTGATDTVGELTGDAPQGATDTVGELTGDAPQGATDTFGELTGDAPQGATDPAGELTGDATKGATDAVGGATDAAGDLTGGLPADGQQGGKQGGPLGAGLLGGSVVPGILKREVGGAQTSEGEQTDYVEVQESKAKRQFDVRADPGSELLDGGKNDLIPGLRTSAPLSPEDIAMLQKNAAQMQKRQLNTVNGPVGGLVDDSKGDIFGGALVPGILRTGEPLSEEDIAKIISGGTVKRDEPLSEKEAA